ncbi:unnamed protein product [Closterium sp. NIES-54]
MAGSYSSASTAMAAEYELVKGLATERELGGEEKEEGEGKEGEGEKGEKDGEKDGDEGGEWKKSGKGKKGKGRRSKEEEAKEKERREKEKERERKAKLPSSKARMEEIASLEQGVGLGDDPKGVLAKVMVKGGADEDAAPVCVESIAFSSFNPVGKLIFQEGRGWMEEIAWASLEQGVGMGDDPKGVLAKVIVKGGADEDAAPVCVESIAFSSVNPVPGPRSITFFWVNSKVSACASRASRSPPSTPFLVPEGRSRLPGGGDSRRHALLRDGAHSRDSLSTTVAVLVAHVSYPSPSPTTAFHPSAPLQAAGRPGVFGGGDGRGKALLCDGSHEGLLCQPQWQRPQAGPAPR